MYFQVICLLILIVYTCVEKTSRKKALSELEKTITVYSKVKSKVNLSRYKRSSRTNLSQMARFIFMHFFRKLKMSKNEI